MNPHHPEPRPLNPPAPAPLTPEQLAVLRFIRKYRAERGVSPTTREVAEFRKKSLSGTMGLIDRLIKRGALVRPGGPHARWSRGLVPAGE